MTQKSESIGLLNLGWLGKLLNIGHHEWSRVNVCWALNFFFKFGYTVGWVILTAMFVNRFGISKLPLLFLVGGSLTVIGTIFYSEMLHRVRKEILMITTIIVASLILLSSTVFPDKNTPLFFVLVLVAASLFLAQLHILISLFAENMFTPLESQRTFPIIESAETLGGIVGGAAVSIFSSYIPPYKFLYVWIIAIFFIIPVILAFSHHAETTPSLRFRMSRLFPRQKRERLEESVQAIRKMPFLKALILIVLFQWIFVNLMEFQYTKAVQQWVTDTPEVTLIASPKLHDDLQASIVGKDFEAGSPAAEVALAHQLGSLLTVFSALALLVQLLLAGRLISSLGVIGSMLLTPIVMLASVLGLFFRFGFLTAVLSRTNFEVTHILHNNAYHTSFYAFREDLREYVREFLDGFIKPMGVVLGMFALIILQNLFSGPYLTTTVTVLMGIIMLAMLFIILGLRTKYTRVASETLLDGDSTQAAEKFTAIEILAQRGHEDATDILRRALDRASGRMRLKIKILEALGELQDFDSLPDILNALDDAHPDVRLAAVRALSNFPRLGDRFYAQAIARHQITKKLQDLFARENSDEIRAEIVKVFAHLKDPSTISFLFDLMESADDSVRAACLYVFGMFRDSTAICIIEPNLSSPHPRVKANAIVALWQFPRKQEELRALIADMLRGNNVQERVAALYAAGELRLAWAGPYILAALQRDDWQERLHASIALAKLGDERALHGLVEFIASDDPNVAETLKSLLRSIPDRERRPIEKYIGRALAHEIEQTINSEGHEHFETFDANILRRIRTMYELVGQFEELEEIDRILEERQKNSDNISA